MSLAWIFGSVVSTCVCACVRACANSACYYEMEQGKYMNHVLVTFSGFLCWCCATRCSLSCLPLIGRSPSRSSRSGSSSSRRHHRRRRLFLHHHGTSPGPRSFIVGIIVDRFCWPTPPTGTRRDTVAVPTTVAATTVSSIWIQGGTDIVLPRQLAYCFPSPECPSLVNLLVMKQKKIEIILADFVVSIMYTWTCVDITSQK